MFHDRTEAGRLLAKRLRDSVLSSIEGDSPVVIALPRGGVVVGQAVAEDLKIPLDILIVRKIGAPSEPEFGIGAIAEDGTSWINVEFANAVGATRLMIQEIMQFESEEISRRIKRIRQGREPLSLEGRSVILVDDGLATGATALVAARSLRRQRVKKIILAVPACASDSLDLIKREVNEVICLTSSENFQSVSKWYEDFSQVSDDQVIETLAKFQDQKALFDVYSEVEITSGELHLPGELVVPSGALGLVIFAHGSGSSRMSPRNLMVARALNRAKIGTLLFDLLTPQESEERENVFDVDLLSKRLISATQWVRTYPETKPLKIGYFGASTGAAAALKAASQFGNGIAAVVSRGGRPDLTGNRIHLVDTPTLLIVGGNDEIVLALNRQAQSQLKNARVLVIPGATHLFEEPGALEHVAEYSIDWFTKHFSEVAAKAA